MLARSTRIAFLVAIMVGALVLRHLWPEEANRGRSDARPSPTSAAPTDGAQTERAAPPGVVSSEGDPYAHRAMPPATPIASLSSVPPIALRVIAPMEARTGDVFDVRIDVEARSGVDLFLLALTYDPRRLALVGWSKGTFAQDDAGSEVGVQEPSDGNIEVRFRLPQGHLASGAGSIAVLQFEALEAGTSAISVANVAVTDRPGAGGRNGASIVQQGMVTVR